MKILLAAAAFTLAIIGLNRAEAWDHEDYGRQPPPAYIPPSSYDRRIDNSRWMSDFGLRLYQYSQPYYTPHYTPYNQHNIQHWNSVYPRGFDRY